MARYAAIVAAAVFAAAGMSYGQNQGADKPAAKQAEPKKEEATLVVGSKAPELHVAKWLKGEPVTGFEKGRTYVVEFWATWCGPCKKSIPHLTELQKAHPGVKFIGVSVWETDQGKVEPFVREWGGKMDYTVAMDEVPPLPEGTKNDTRDAQKFYIKNGTMAQTWMKAAGRGGIPSAFIVDGTGTVQWIGHPMWLDVALEPVLKGDAASGREASKKAEKEYSDVFKAKEPKEKWANFQKFERDYPATAATMTDTKYELMSSAGDPKAAELGRSLADRAIREKDIGLLSTMMNGEPREGLRVLRAYEKANGPVTELSQQKYALLLKADDAEGIDMGRTLLQQALEDKDAMKLNQVAWAIVDPEAKVEHKDLETALKAATKAVELSEEKNAAILDTLARVYFVKGDSARAVELEKKAVELATGPMKEELEGSLKEFEGKK